MVDPIPFIKELVVLFLCLGNLFVIPCVLATEVNQPQGEMEGFALEIPDEKGQKQALLEGTKATFDEASVIRITNVKAKIFRSDKGEIIFTSSMAKYHRDSKVVTSDQPIKVDSRDAHITGTGFVWEPEKEKLFIPENVRAVLKNVQKGERGS